MIKHPKFILKCTATLPCILFLSTTSCVQKKLDGRLEEHRQNQKELNKSLTNATFSSARQHLSWNQAKKMVLERNLAYQTQVVNYNKTSENRKKIWFSLAPKIFTFVSINSSLDQIADISSEDINLNISSNLNIPNPIAFYARLYAAALSELQSKYQLELTKRQLISRLYTSYLRSKELDQRLIEINKQQSSLDELPPERIASTFKNIETAKFQIESSFETLRINNNELFNTPGKHWHLNGRIPNISYENSINSLSFENGFGTLGLKLQAIQIEGILASLWSSKTARLPSLSIGLTTPQLYNSNSEENFNFNPEDYTFFTGLSKSFEITDPLNKESLRDAKFRATISRSQLRLRLESEISRLESTKRFYKQLIAKRRIAQKVIKAINQSSASASPAQIEAELSKLKTAKNTIENINRQLTQLDLQLWIFDDSFWK